MTQNLPSTQVYSLEDVKVDVRNQMIEFNNALLNTLHKKTLSEIKNAFTSAAVVTNYGAMYFKVEQLDRLLRTGNSGAAGYMWQHGIHGFSSGATPYQLGQDICISAADFLALVEARIQTTFGKPNIYLKYVKALYSTISSLPVFQDLRTVFASNIEQQRSQLKAQRIATYHVQRCEFTDHQFASQSEVQFAHIDSVVMNPLQALNIDNGVIIMREIHAKLTALNIHDFAGMYDFCEQNHYSIVWAENYYK